MKIIRCVLAYTYITLGIMLFLLVILGFYATINLINSNIPIEIEGTYAFEEQKWQLYGGFLPGVIFSFLTIFFTPLCFSKARKLLRKNKMKISAEVKYNEPFVLYLRSFFSDNLSKKVVDPVFATSNTEEEALINVLSEVAPVFAIGNPLDKYSPFGANRLYVEEHQWKNKVIEMAQCAKIIVLRLGETDNFWWEVEMCLKNIDKNKLLFIVPFSHNFSTVAILYKYLFENNIILENCNVEISKTSKGSISSFLYFGKDGSFVCENMKSYRLTSWVISYENMIRNSLSTFFERYGLYYQKLMNINKARLIQVTVIPITILVMFLYSYFGVYEMQHRTSLPQKDKSIITIVENINNNCPKMIDSETRLDNVVINQDNELQQNFTIVNWVKDSIDVQFFKSSMSNLILDKIKTDPKMKYFRDNNVTFSFYYSDKKGVLITSLTISPEKYK